MGSEKNCLGLEEGLMHEDEEEALKSIDPERARDDPVIVKNVPHYMAKKALEAEVMKLDPPPRPPSWGVRIHCLDVNMQV
ncbi:hypothetical protein K1719_046050 [Acacia pycnantha]|nr:hypothetical protein K1719_046050 [Acacia pycnantha]